MFYSCYRALFCIHLWMGNFLKAPELFTVQKWMLCSFQSRSTILHVSSLQNHNACPIFFALPHITLKPGNIHTRRHQELLNLNRVSLLLLVRVRSRAKGLQWGPECCGITYARSVKIIEQTIHHCPRNI